MRRWLLVCCVAVAGCSAPNKVASRATEPSSAKGLDAQYWSARFSAPKGSSTPDKLVITAVIDNKTDKVMTDIDLHVSVRYPGSVPGIEQEFTKVPIRPDSEIMIGAIPPGQAAVVRDLAVAIKPEQWRTDYQITVGITKSKEMTPANNEGWQVIALTGSVEEAVKAVKDDPELKSKTNVQGVGFLPLAISSGNVEKVKALVKAGFDLHAETGGRNALHWAALSNAEMVAYISGQGIKSQLDAIGMLPVSLAIEGNHPEALQALIENGSNVEQRDGEWNTALLKVAAANEIPCAQVVLRHKPKADVFNQKGQSPLGAAAWSGWPELLDLIYEADKDVNARDPQTGRTPLHFAVLANKYGNIKWLMQKGARLDTKDKNGETPVDMVKQFSSEVDRQRLLQSLGK